MNSEVRERQRQKHFEKYEAYAQWLGIAELQALIPFPQSAIDAALINGDEHLNTWGNEPWDKQHGFTREELAPTQCRCCKQSVPNYRNPTQGVLGLIRAALKHPGTPPGHKEKRICWALCETVCVLKHVAVHHPRTPNVILWSAHQSSIDWK